MSAAVLLDPYSSSECSAPEDSRLAEGAVSLSCHDTPQLSLQDYRRWQYSPALSASPQLDYRRIRRKPSIQNLTGRSAHSAFSWTPSSIPSPSTHNSGPHNLQLQQPSTPRPRAYTASPSLSSTISTLQSTPTHTPIFRGDSFDEQRRKVERCELGDSIGSKRKYPSVKHARRFPRPARATGGEGSQDSGVYVVHAAVFDISGEQGGLSKDSSKGVVHTSETQEAPTSRKERAVRFTGIDTEHSSHSIGSTPSSAPSSHRRDQTATSSFSLSKFEFPAPPNKDNWAGAFDRLPKSPSATVLYRGASFDLINPHASLLLGSHSIETPGEIDGLLDGYFEGHEEPEETVVMASNLDTGETTQQSLRSTSDSKQPRTLYDDADTARRNILRVTTPVAIPPKVLTKELPASAVTMPNFVRAPNPDVQSDITPAPIKRSNTNPYRNKLSTISRSLGFTTNKANQDLAEEGRAAVYAGQRKAETTTTKYNTLRKSTGKNEDRPSFNEDKHCSDQSDPFDLSMSENNGNAELLSIDDVLKREHQAMLASAADPNGRRNALTVEDGPNTHALSETERELGSIYSGYDYTRTETTTCADNDTSTSAASIEDGLNCPDEPEDCGSATLLSAGTQFRSSYHGFRIVEAPKPISPQPLTSRRNNFEHHSNMPSVHREMRLSGTSDIPTSEQTYGETNQLLNITPNNDPSGGRCNPLTCTRHAHVHVDRFSPASTPEHYEHDDKENTPPGLDHNGFARSFAGGPPDPCASLHRGSMVMSPSIIFAHRESRPPHLRTSSIYPESDWVTQRSGSPGLTDTDDEEENVVRYSTSSRSVSSQDALEDRRYLAATPFPSLDNPNPEVSPLRARGQGRAGRKRTTSSIPSVPSCFDRDTDGEIAGKHSRRLGFLPSKRETRSNPEDIPNIDFTSEPTGDARRVLSIISGKAQVDRLGEPRYCSPGDRSSRQLANLQELEGLRVSNPAAVHEATARFHHHSLPNFAPSPSPNPAKSSRVKNPFLREKYQPAKSFQKAAALGRHDIAHGSFSSQKGLLSPHTPSSSGLEFSESEGTFVTVRKKRSDSIMSPDQGWDPHDPSPTARALGLRSTPSTGYTSRVPSKLRSTSGKAGKQVRSAINGQHELHELKLVAVTTRSPGRALTDAELVDREPAWTDVPKVYRPHRKEAKMVPHQKNKEQEIISLKYQNLSALVPFCALIFGLGGFDWIIARKTHGRIKNMGGRQKRYALMVYFPLQMLAYSIVLLVVGIIVYMRTHNPKHT